MHVLTKGRFRFPHVPRREAEVEHGLSPGGLKGGIAVFEGRLYLVEGEGILYGGC